MMNRFDHSDKQPQTPLFFRSFFRGCLLIVFFCSVQTVSLFAEDGDSQFQSAKSLFDQSVQSRNWDSAIQSCQAFLSQFPNHSKRTECEYFLGYSLLHQCNFLDPTQSEDGRNHLNYVLQQGKNAAYYKEASLYYAFSLYCLHRFSEAKVLFERFLSEFPGDAFLQYIDYYLGVCENHLGNYSKAAEYFTICLEQYPNGAYYNESQLERAIAIGKAGNYTEADKILNNLLINPDYPLKEKAMIQRANLKIDQGKLDEALNILDGIIAKYQNDQNALPYLIEANKYKIHCFMEMGDDESALKTIETIEKLSSKNDLDVVLYKIRVLSKLNRFNEANAILDQLANSPFGLNSPDVMAYYKSIVLYGENQWTNIIGSMFNTLKIQYNADTSNSAGGTVTLNYFNNNTSAGNKLLPNDYLAACGVLALAYACRYGATQKYANDDHMQQAILDAMYRYANSQNDKSLMTIVTKVTQERDKIRLNPPTASEEEQNSNAPAQAGTSQYPYPNNTQPGGNPNIPSGLPSGNPNEVAGNSGASNGSNPDQNPAQPAQPNQPAQPAPSDPNATPTEKISETEAYAILNRAETCFKNQDYEKTYELLYDLMTSTETFWTDYPMIASSVVLRRAEALFKLKKYAEARQMCDLLIEKAPQSSQAAYAHFYLGLCYDFNSNNIEEKKKAIEHFEKTATSPYEVAVSEAACYYLGWNEWECFNSTAAAKYFNIIYTKYRNGLYWGHAAWALAQIRFDEKQYEQAEAIVNDALGSHPDKMIIDRLLYLKGKIALKYMDFEKAKTAFSMIITLYPDSSLVTAAKSRLNNLMEKNPAPVPDDETARPATPQENNALS